MLQVFVPSPEGDWLSDASVLECEQELKRAGATHLLRAGDVIWDTAVGDEGNVGRLVWDGNYLIVGHSIVVPSSSSLALIHRDTQDLDYANSRAGDLHEETGSAGGRFTSSVPFFPSWNYRLTPLR